MYSDEEQSSPLRKRIAPLPEKYYPEPDTLESLTSNMHLLDNQEEESEVDKKINDEDQTQSLTTDLDTSATIMAAGRLAMDSQYTATTMEDIEEVDEDDDIDVAVRQDEPILKDETVADNSESNVFKDEEAIEVPDFDTVPGKDLALSFDLLSQVVEESLGTDSNNEFVKPPTLHQDSEGTTLNFQEDEVEQANNGLADQDIVKALGDLTKTMLPQLSLDSEASWSMEQDVIEALGLLKGSHFNIDKV